MIKELTLINFQIHKKIKIEFDEKFNVIVGHNNKGKSSIIRAIYWVMYNEPVGDWMRRIDEDGNMTETLVKIKFFDGDIVKRIKGDGLNKYVVNGDEFENFGYGVPQRVKEILNVHKFETNKFEFPLNIFMQDDQPFLIHETGPVKASVIDVLTGVSLLQKTISEFNKERLESSKLSKLKQDQIEEDKKQLESLPDLKKAQELVEQAEEIHNQTSTLELESNNLKILKDKYKFATETIEKVNSQHVDVDMLVKSKETLENIDLNIRKLKDLRLKLNQSQKTINLPDVDLEKVTNIVQDIQKLKDDYECLKKKRSLLVDSWNNSVIVENELPLAEKELKDLWKELGMCPLCGVKQ
jgi:exonuclease SbcC